MSDKKQKAIINDVSADKDGFYVLCFTIIEDEDDLYSMHYADGLNMIIIKGDTTLHLNGDEIRQIVRTLPRTLSGRYEK